MLGVLELELAGVGSVGGGEGGVVGGLLANDIGAGAEWVGSGGQERAANEAMIMVGLEVVWSRVGIRYVEDEEGEGEGGGEAEEEAVQDPTRYRH